MLRPRRRGREGMELMKNNYQEEKCQTQIDALYECCNLFYQRNGDEASTVSCPKASLLSLKMKQRSGAEASK
ncbi:Cx9C motif-containing protein 4, mitochondrial [Salinomyces thailandicus]|uniref:Cx9C motif-containing protein 4, mitochondrial n=1 Tax=Salinomyces thailandicus TaxID=706561 RepID=A0A4U0U1G3_9PEZI|nr:Cx9C motif-containing protein 4, mitochondrial [Salinomyces thailandica]